MKEVGLDKVKSNHNNLQVSGRGCILKLILSLGGRYLNKVAEMLID